MFISYYPLNRNRGHGLPGLPRPTTAAVHVADLICEGGCGSMDRVLWGLGGMMLHLSHTRIGGLYTDPDEMLFFGSFGIFTK